MQGQYTIDVRNRSTRFKLTISRNITILKGDSATGKSTLVQLIREYSVNGEQSGISLTCDAKCYVADDANWESICTQRENSIIFVDEGARFIKTIEFACIVQNSSNYYVLVTRERLANLAYSVDEIYGLKNTTKTKYANYTVFHSNLHKIYKSTKPGRIPLPECVIVEYSCSGYEFFSTVFSAYDIPCISAGGNANIFRTVREREENNILVIADGAAFGQEMERLNSLSYIKKITLYLPESFEWLVLKSGLFNSGNVADILEHPYDYIASEQYYTWERFFTELLIRESQSIVYLNYQKAHLNENYLQPQTKKAIIAEMPEVVER